MGEFHRNVRFTVWGLSYVRQVDIIGWGFHMKFCDFLHFHSSLKVPKMRGGGGGNK